MRLELSRYLRSKQNAVELNSLHTLETIEPEVLKAAMDATVSFHYKDETGEIRTKFTGVHIGNGSILTVKHGIEDYEKWDLIGKTNRGEYFNNIDVVKTGDDIDLALLYAEEFETHSQATLSTSTHPKPQDTMFVVNFTESLANAFRVRFVTNKFPKHDPTLGDVFAFEDHIDPDVVMNTVRPGTSGSGVFNAVGKLEGIVFNRYLGNMTLATNSNGIKDFLDNS